MHVQTFDDTHPAIRARIVEGYRRMTPAEKLDCVRRLTIAAHELALTDVRRRHPEAGIREQALRVASRRIDPSVMLSAFGWDVRLAGY